jgi:alkylation response protein AidB-like acyl-CoA dehydrogenase
MQFGLNESQEILKQNSRQFFAGECPMTLVRQLAESKQPYDAALWSKMAAQGYMGIIFPEKYDGLGLGIVELILLMEEAGRALLPGPFWSTVAFAGAVIEAVATEAQKTKYLTRICRGEARATLALLEAGAGWDLADVKLTAANGKLTGEKLFVLDADVADFVLVAAQTGIFLVEAGAPGLSLMPMPALDLTRNFYAVQFNDTPAEKLGDAANFYVASLYPPNLARAFDIATAALVAEMVGGMQRVLDLTVEYAKTRKQFGKAIGTFQAVQHQCADMYLDTESSRSAAYYAAWALEHDAPDAATATSIAKMYASDACREVGNRGIQIHGGNGFAWENDLHLYYRRAKASETMLGDATFHRERIARLVIDSAPVSTCTNNRSSR